ncbi:MAG: AsmA family protein [Candidatus Omnitrophica bacterium]|nr:AsmA family protein [Candidatus Omnitrophota bacterium]
MDKGDSIVKLLKIISMWILGLFIVSVMLLVAFVKFYDFNKHKPAIIQQANSALGRDINFEKISLDISFAQGLSLKISDLRIAEDPVFGNEDFMSVKNISLGISPMSYILFRKINILKVLIDSPRVKIIRLKDGRINAAGLGSRSGQAGAGSEQSAPGSSPAGDQRNAGHAAAGSASPAFALPDIAVSYLRIDSAKVTYVDRSFDPAFSLDIPELYVSLSNISMTDPFPFIVEASFISDSRNIKLEGRAQFNAATGEITISGLKAGTDLSDIKIAKIPETLPQAKGAVLPEILEGIIDARFDTLTAGPNGLSALKASVSAAKGIAQFKELVAPIKNIAIAATLTQSDIILDNAYFTIGTGMVRSSGVVNGYQAKQTYSVSADIDNIKIQSLVVQDKAPVKAEGTVSGTVKLNGEGLTPEGLKSDISGTADIAIAKPKLKDLNVLREVLNKISVLPGLSQSIEMSLPEKYRQKLELKDTSFEDIKLPVGISNGRIVLADTKIASEDFVFQGGAVADMGGAYSIEGAVLLSNELSAATAGSVPQMKYLLNESDQIYIPVKVSGSAGQVKIDVDAAYIGRKLLENQAKQQIFKAVDKFLGAKEEPAQSGDQTGQQETESDQSPVKDTISNIIGNIFKK